MTSTALFNLTDGLGYSASLPCNQSAASLSLQGLNCSTGTSSYDEALAFSPAKQTSDWITGCFVVVNVVVAVLAVLGNCTVVYVVFAYRRMRTVTNYFIANLALSDVLMALFCIPANTVTNLLLQYEDWPFYEWVCPLLMYAQTVAVFTSAFTLVTISLDRYLAIIYPMKPRTTSGQASVAMAIVWLAAILVSLPTAMHSEVISHPTGVSPKTTLRRSVAVHGQTADVHCRCAGSSVRAAIAGAGIHLHPYCCGDLGEEGTRGSGR